ncbi:hypothetical protein LPJ61_001728 [Coemansia biformis]|uniref:Uncharacterized protein n=1 Tax=Coemansia biformis TaxID=1286918 RepID=A0A9W7YEC6_9FUNG|nr:hypothetical protein LPJ61_001728 [Coemansia biformis]
MAEPQLQAGEEKTDLPPVVSRMSMSNESAAPAMTGAAAFRANIAQMFADRKLLKHLYYFIGLCLVSFLPLMFAGIALAFSSPSGGAKIAIYLTTLTIAFVSIGFSGWLTYQRLCRAIGNDDGSRARRVSEVNIVGAPTEAFTPSQQYYNGAANDDDDDDDSDSGAQPRSHAITMHIPDSTIPPVPPLPPIGQMPYPPPYHGSASQQSHPPQLSMPLPPVPAALPPLPPVGALTGVPPAPPLPPAGALPGVPPAPPLPLGGVPVPPPIHHYDGRLSASESKAYGLGKDIDADNDYYDDGIKLYSFETVKVQPDKSQGYAMHRRMSRSVPELGHEESEYGGAGHNNQRHMLVASELLSASDAGDSGYQQYSANVPSRPDMHPSVVPANRYEEARARGSSIYEQAPQPQNPNAPAASSIDDLLETMLETFTDGSRPNTTVSKPPPPSVPLPLPRPPITEATTADMTANVQRKGSGKRRVAATRQFGDNSDDGDFLDSDSDAMSSRGVSPAAKQRPDVNSEGTGKWKPASVNFDNIAAHIALALNQPNGPQGTRGGLHVANVSSSRDSVSIEVCTPDLTPRRAEQATTPPAQRAVVHTRTPPNGHVQKYDIESVTSASTFD